MIYRTPPFVKILLIALIYVVPAALIFGLGTMEIAILSGVSAIFGVELFDSTLRLIMWIYTRLK